MTTDDDAPVRVVRSQSVQLGELSMTPDLDLRRQDPTDREYVKVKLGNGVQWVDVDALEQLGGAVYDLAAFCRANLEPPPVAPPVAPDPWLDPHGINREAELDEALARRDPLPEVDPLDAEAELDGAEPRPTPK